MWIFNNRKKELQSAQLDEADKEMIIARNRFSEVLRKIESARHDEIQAMLQGLLPKRIGKSK